MELKQATEALRVGKYVEARQMLDELVVKEPDNAEAWQMLISVAENPLEKLDCLKQVVRIHPEDERAKKRLHKYKAGAEYREFKVAHHYAIQRKERRKKKQKEILKGSIYFLKGFLLTLKDIFGRRRYL